VLQNLLKLTPNSKQRGGLHPALFHMAKQQDVALSSSSGETLKRKKSLLFVHFSGPKSMVSSDSLFKDDNEHGHLVDGFSIPLKIKPLSSKGSYFSETANGYFRHAYMILKNQELYLFSNNDAKGHEKMFVLSPGVFIKMGSQISKQSHPGLAFLKISRLFPIELVLGGRAAGPKGQKTERGRVTMYFETREV